jgi:hypothetical protein
MKNERIYFIICIFFFCCLVPFSMVAQKKGYVFLENPDSVLSIEAEHYYAAKAVNGTSWKVIPYFGKTLSGLTLLPTTVNPYGSRLEYRMEINTSINEVAVTVYLAPTLNFEGGDGLFYLLSFDDGMPVKVNMNGPASDYEMSMWQRNRINCKKTLLSIKQTKNKQHVLTFSPLSPAMVIEKIVVDCGGLKPSYLGPPESLFYK